jgi:DNA-directed RNA polymerase specialized sigma subunit
MVEKVEKKEKHYINNKRFEELVLNYKTDRPKYELELVETLDLLITNILMSFRFKVDHDDAKQECFVLCLRVLENFSSEKGSAFNYFTTVIINNLKLMFTKNKKYNQKLAEYRKMHGEENNSFHESESEDLIT